MLRWEDMTLLVVRDKVGQIKKKGTHFIIEMNEILFNLTSTFGHYDSWHVVFVSVANWLYNINGMRDQASGIIPLPLVEILLFSG